MGMSKTEAADLDAAAMLVAERLDRGLRDGDVDHAYVLAFGRHAEAEAVEGRRGQSRRTVLADLLGAEEFVERVLRPLRAEQALPGDLFDAAPPADLLPWAADFLPLSPSGQAALLQVSTWYATYDILFNDPVFAAFADEVQPAIGAQAMGLVARRLHARTGARLVVGGLDEVSPIRVVGWALNVNNPDEPVALEAYVDGGFAGATVTGRMRRDLQDRFGGQGHFGFEFAGLSPPAAGPGRLEVREAVSQLTVGSALLTWRREAEASQLGQLRKDVQAVREMAERLEAKLDLVGGAFGFYLADYDSYRRAYYPDTPLRRFQVADEAAAFASRPHLSVLTALTPETVLELDASVQSLRDQLYGEFELVLFAAPGLAPEQLQAAHRAAAVRLGYRVRAAEVADGPHLAMRGHAVFLTAGDRLAADALHVLAAALQGDAPARLLYSDEDAFTADRAGRLRFEAPRLKPGFDPDLELQSGYMGDLLAIAGPDLGRLLDQGGSLDPDRRPELVLSALDLIPPEAISHLPRVLYHRRAAAGVAEASLRLAAVSRHLARRGEAAEVSSHADPLGPEAPGAVRVRRPALLEGRRAAVIIPTRDRLDLIGPCLAGLLGGSGRNRIPFETLVIDNAGRVEAARLFLRSLEAGDRIRLLSYPHAFNWGAINNFAAAQTEADVLIFLNNDTLDLTRDWIDELCEQALRPDVGVVGARLLYEDGTLQHAGMVSGTTGGLILHEGVGRPSTEAGYLGRHTLLHRTRSVTGACLATRASVFRELGGFDEHAFALDASDVDYCLRVQGQGLSVLYDPYATLYHFESKTRGQTGAEEGRRARFAAETARLEERWGEALRHDPYYNPHFDRFSPPFSRLGAPEGS